MVDYGPLYQAAGDQYGIDPLLLQTLAGKESNQDPNAVGPMITQGPAAGQHALGLMQFIPQTAAQYDVAYPMSPVQSTYGAANYLDTLLKKHDGNLRAALAEYSGNGGNVNAPYVKDVMDRYTGLSRAWSATGPSAAGPTTDTDPDSPTTGSATYANLQRPSGPGDLTTAKGNAGQPAPSVPTTDKGGVSYTTAPSTTFAPPGQGGPKGQRTDAAPAPDYLHDAPAPGAAPAAPAAPAVSSGPDYLHDAPQQVDADGNPIKPMDTGQYLTSATSPGAKAVMPLAGPLEGFELPAASQYKIGSALDPMQRVRIAAQEAGVTPDSIIVGSDGRLAAVGKNGTPYYLTPQRIFANQEGVTKQGDQGPNLAQLVWNRRAVSDNANAPAGEFEPIGAGVGSFFRFSPYSTQSSWAPNAPGSFDTGNLIRGGAAELAQAPRNALIAGGAAAGTALGYPTLGVAAGTAAGDLAARAQASYFDPAAWKDRPSWDIPGIGRDVILNSLLTRGGNFLANQIGPDLAASWRAGGGEMPAPSTALKSSLRTEVPVQYPLGEAGGGRAPWERPVEWPSEIPMPGGEATPVPGAAPLDIDPATGRPVPQAVPGLKSEAQIAAEDAAVPTTAPRVLFPLRNQAAVDRYAADTVRWFAQGGNTAPEAGAQGNLAEITGNRGLAGLLRSMRDKTGPVGNEVGLYEDARDAALRNDLGNLKGSAEDLANAEQARDVQTSALAQKAFAKTTPTDASPSLNVADEALRSPEAQRPAVAAALRDARERLFQKDPVTGKLLEDANGNPMLITDPEQLWGVVKGLRSDMSSAAQSGRVDMRIASRELGPLVQQLDKDIEAGAPDYAGFNQAYRDASKPINAMRYLQGRNLVDVQTGTPILSRIQATLDDINKQRTLKFGWQPADDLSDQQIQQLTDLRDALRRKQNIRTGQSIGSSTSQNLGIDAVTNALTRPVTALGVRAAAGLLGWHNWGDLGFLISQQLEHAVSSGVERRALERQQDVYKAITKLLLNRNGEGVAALREAPGAPPPPNALTGP